MIVATVAWTAFAFGGVYPSTLVIPCLLVVALALACRPAMFHRGPAPQVDAALVLVAAAVILQLVPLPRLLVASLSPATVRLADSFSLIRGSGALPLAVDLQSAAGAAVLLATTLLLFFAARQIFESGGIRTVVRGLALTGLLLACVAIAQDATGRGLMYWRWRPVFERAFPFGPFVNRNHFGTWAMMVVPLCVGYLVAHTEAHRQVSGLPWRRRVLALLDARRWQLVSAVVLLIVATVASLSRSAMVGMAASVAFGALLGMRHARDTPRERRAVILVAVTSGIALGAILLRVEPEAISGRIAAAGVGLADRAEIWRTTLAIIGDFWATGTGIGTFQAAMVMYQQSSPGVIFNQAHNHYLQLAAEGGLLVGLPVLLALAAFSRRAAEAIARDQSAMVWVRAGAAAGLVGVAVQSIFETGLLTPANALVAAVLAAMIVHEPGRSETVDPRIR